MKNTTELDENEIRKIAAEIELDYIELSDSDWHKILEVLSARANI